MPQAELPLIAPHKQQTRRMGDSSPEGVQEFLSQLPAPVQERLAEVRKLHEQYAELEDQCQKEIQAVEAKYLAMFREPPDPCCARPCLRPAPAASHSS